MAKEQVEKYLQEQSNSIFSQSNEMKAYNLGLANGYLFLYQYLKTIGSVKEADDIFKPILHSSGDVNELFRKLIDLENMPEVKDNEFVVKWQEIK